MDCFRGQQGGRLVLDEGNPEGIQLRGHHDVVGPIPRAQAPLKCNCSNLNHGLQAHGCDTPGCERKSSLTRDGCKR
eukprot:9040844-Alexandrium_andersonii.AAC.1